MDSYHWVIIYQCFYFDTLNIPLLVSGSPLKVMLVSFWHASINLLSISLLVAQDALGWLFLHISRIDHFSKELWSLPVQNGIWKPKSGWWICSLLLVHHYLFFFFLVDKANDDGRRREHYCNLRWFEAHALLSFLVMLNVWGMCGINLFLVDVSFVGKMCRVIWIQETILIWALTRAFEIWGLLLFLISRALSVSRVFKIN